MALQVNVQEWMLVQRKDGSLLANMRNHYEKNLRATSLSADRGLTWSHFSHHDELISSVCQSCIIWSSQRHKKYLLFSNPADTARKRMMVRASVDEGESWPFEQVIHEGPAAYSSMAMMPDGQVGILYEKGDKSPYETVTFTKFPLEWLVR